MFTFWHLSAWVPMELNSWDLTKDVPHFNEFHRNISKSLAPGERVALRFLTLEPKLEVPTIYKVYFSGLNFREYAHKIWPYSMVLTYLHFNFRFLKWPLNGSWFLPKSSATSPGQMNAVAEDGDMEAMRKHFEVAMKERTAAALVLEPNILAAGEVPWCLAYRKGRHG